MSCCCSLASTLPSLPWLQRCEYTQYMKLVYSSSASAHWEGTSGFYLKPILIFSYLWTIHYGECGHLLYLYLMELYFLLFCILFDNSLYASCGLMTVQAARAEETSAAVSRRWLPVMPVQPGLAGPEPLSVVTLLSWEQSGDRRVSRETSQVLNSHQGAPSWWHGPRMITDGDTVVVIRKD